MHKVLTANNRTVGAASGREMYERPLGACLRLVPSSCKLRVQTRFSFAPTGRSYQNHMVRRLRDKQIAADLTPDIKKPRVSRHGVFSMAGLP